MPPSSEVSARIEELTKTITSFLGSVKYTATRVRNVAAMSIVRAKNDAEFLHWAIDVLTSGEDLTWGKAATVVKEEVQAKLRGGEKRDHVSVELGGPVERSLQGNAGMGHASGHASSHPRGDHSLSDLPAAASTLGSPEQPRAARSRCADLFPAREPAPRAAFAPLCTSPPLSPAGLIPAH
jgi:hypothetical protein